MAERRAEPLAKSAPAGEARQRGSTIADAATAPAQAPDTGPAAAAPPPALTGRPLPRPAPSPSPSPAVGAPIAPAPRAGLPESATSARDTASAANDTRPGTTAPPESFPAAAARRDATAAGLRASGNSVQAAPALLPSLLNGAGLEPAQRRLLKRLDDLARGRWQFQPPGAGEPATAPLRGWQLANGAASSVRLRLDADGLRWAEPDGSRWFVPLDTAAVRELQALR